ncbi:hypothetical protein ABEG63_19995 [Chryseobacterium sp. C39-AII1]|uniref:hypothetical protein n=1 Tax=Chryseobacterium sp. C39-AII1 TaxID=3080332 RepID=UPI0032089C78
MGAVLSPLGHAGFFYVGEIYKAIYHTDAAAHPYLLKTGRGFMKMLNIAWVQQLAFWQSVGLLLRFAFF